jgi:hypothetical protein
MKSRPSLKNSARTVLSLLLIISLICGCSSSTSPTYFKENIEKSIQDICQEEYQIEIKAKLAGRTLWLYLPLEDLFQKADKPEKYFERFEITNNQAEFKDGSLRLNYLIKAIPEKEKLQQYKYNKETFEKINKVWKVIRRITFSMAHSGKSEPQFFCLVTADIKNGFQMKETFYYLDLKKVSYEYISWGEYQHARDYRR